MSEKETGSAAAEAPKKGSKMIIIIVIAVLLVGVGGGGFFYWRSTSVAAAEKAKKSEKNDKSEKKSKKEADEIETAAEDIKTAEKKAESKGEPDALQNALPTDEDVKKIVELPPFIVNLADTESARYLRMTVSLGVGGADSESEKPDQLFMTRVRNAMLAVLSDRKSDQILSVEGKTKLRKQLLEAAKAASEEPEVKAIYITDFIVQL